MPFANAPAVDTEPVRLDDQTIRAAYVQHLSRLNERGTDYVVFEEVGVHHGSNRFDLVVLKPGQPLLMGIEIKSDLDSLTRLADQVKAFNTVATHMTLVVGQKHLIRALSTIPEWWGVVLVAQNEDRTISIQTVREPQANPKPRATWVARLLWRSELLDLLKALGAGAGTTKLRHNKLATKLIETVPLSQLYGLVTQTMATRQTRPDRGPVGPWKRNLVALR